MRILVLVVKTMTRLLFIQVDTVLVKRMIGKFTNLIFGFLIGPVLFTKNSAE
jgi:hypothetical protein